jgi:hypothetical protein
MNDIEDMKLQEYELKLADVDDPVAQKVSWNALNPGGSNFKTQDLVVSNDKVRIVKSKSMNLFIAAFIVSGIMAFLVGLYMLFFSEQVIGLFLAFWGACFGGIAYFVLRPQSKNFTIDRFNGTYYIGNEFDNVNHKDRRVQGYIKNIHAIQLLEERVSTKSKKDRSSRSYKSYEMNLVFEDGERINIMDHGSAEDVDASAIELGSILNVPIWKAQY